MTDSFKVYDHEAKENLSGSYQGSIFDTDNQENVLKTPDSAISGNDSDFFTPRVYPSQYRNSEAAATPKTPGLNYSLRPTPMREIHFNGGTPHRETNQSFYSRKSRKSVHSKSSVKIVGEDKTLDGTVLAEASYSIDHTFVNPTDASINRSTYNAAEISGIIQKLNETLEIKDDVPQESQAMNEAGNNEPESVDKDIDPSDAEQAVALAEEEFGDVISKIDKTDTNLSLQNSMSKSRRSSYIVQSPVVAHVHFAESIESQVTPKTDDHYTKIKNRQQTPITVSTFNVSQKTNTRKSTLAKGSTAGKQIDRVQKYIKRFSKTLTKEGEGSSKENQPQPSVIKKVQPVVDYKKPLSTKSNPFKMNRAAALLLEKRRLTANRSGAVPRTSKMNSEDIPKPRAEFKSLAQMSQNFLVSARHYSPKYGQTNTKRSLTKPRAPRLLTEQRAKCNRVHHEDVVDNVKPVNKFPIRKVAKENAVKPDANRAPQAVVSNVSRKLTKPRAPNFCTDARVKVWHSKPHESAPVQQFRFRAKPAPNFKVIQAKSVKILAEKKANLAFGNKNAIEMKPFSFENRELLRKQQKQQSASTDHH